MAVVHEREPVIAPDTADEATVRALDAMLAESQGPARLIAPSGREEIELPHSVFRVLAQVVREMAQGNAVRVMPIHAELTTQEAADLLNVSRPFLIGLLEQEVIPYRMVGTHRRILLENLLVYKAARDDKRRKLLDGMVREAQEEGFYED